MRTRNKQAKDQSSNKRPKRGTDTSDTANDNPKTPNKNDKRKSTNNKPETPNKAKKRPNIDVDADNDTSEDKDKRKRCDVSKISYPLSSDQRANNFSSFCFLYPPHRVLPKASTQTVDQNLLLMIRRTQANHRKVHRRFMYLKIPRRN